MKKILLGISTILFLSGIAYADPFVITSTLTGDPRPENPDNLFINVTVTGDTTSSVTYWTIDIASPDHPDAKLDEFYFNLLLGSNTVAFTEFDPTGWDVEANPSVQGGGNITFDFGALDPSGPPDADDVTNDQDLTFTATLQGGVFWTTAMFYDALISTSSDAILGGGQLGAHLQSLGTDGEESGFLLGNYNPIPEPATLLLFGVGLLGISGVARNKKY